MHTHYLQVKTTYHTDTHKCTKKRTITRTNIYIQSLTHMGEHRKEKIIARTPLQTLTHTYKINIELRKCNCKHTETSTYTHTWALGHKHTITHTHVDTSIHTQMYKDMHARKQNVHMYIHIRPTHPHTHGCTKRKISQSCVHTLTHTYKINIQSQIYICRHTEIFIYTCAHIHVHININIQSHTHTLRYIHTNMHTYRCTNICAQGK